MFSFFKKKPKDADLQGDLRRAVSDLRSELGDDAVAKGMALNERVGRLRSVSFEFIQSLLELSDEITDRIREQYKEFGLLDVLEVDAFCASIVATAVFTTDLPENEAYEVVDIYLGLWSETAAKNHPGVQELALKAHLDNLWSEYSRLILKTFGEPTQQVVVNEDSAARHLVRNIDRLAKVTREDGKEGVAAVMFKATIGEAIRIVALNAA